MPNLSPTLASSIWYAALEQEFGMAIELDEGAFITTEYNRLLSSKAEAKDPRLDTLAIMTPEGLHEIWIVKRPTEVADAKPL